MPNLTNTISNSIKLKDLQRKHPDYTKYVKYWEYGKKIYRGGYELSLEDILPKFYREISEERQFRAAITPFVNFAKKIIEYMPKMVFSQDVNRVGDYTKDFESFITNIDLNGGKIKNFNKDLIKLKRAVGKMILLVESTKETPYAPYIVTYYPENLINWGIKNKEYDWVVFEESNYLQDKIFNEPVNIKTYRYIDRNEIIVWECYKNKLSVKNGFPIKNPINEVPVVIYDNTYNQAGLKMVDYQFYDIAKICVAFINVLSSLMMNIFLQNGIMILPDDEVEEHGMQDSTIGKFLNKFGWSNLRSLRAKQMSLNSALIENERTKGLTRILNPSNTIPQHIQTLEYLMTLMNSVGGIGNLDERGESGITKGYRFAETKSNLNDLADYAEQKEKDIIYFGLKWSNVNSNKKIDKNKIFVNYERNYDITEISDVFKDLKEAEETVLIHSQTFMKEFSENSSKIILNDIDDAKCKQISEEIASEVAKLGLIKQLKEA